MKRLLLIGFALVMGASLFTSCEVEDKETPTNELMEGVWELTEVYDENGVEKRDSLFSVFPSFIQLTDQESVNSTLGPLFMYIVYGESSFINATSKINEVFKYADLELTEGDWYIDKNKVVDEFTIKVKMRFPTLDIANEIFEIFNIPLPEIVEDAIDVIVHHKFKYVTVIINDNDPDKMVWEFTDNVVASYNTMDKDGDPVLYAGVSTNNFSRCRLVFKKKIKSINDIVTESYAK